MTFLIAGSSIVRRILDVVLLVLIAIVVVTVGVSRVVPAVTGGATFVVGSGSMEPTVPVGSVVIDLPVTADQLAVGDVVSLKVGTQQAVFTHRIVRIVERDGGRWIETKGDANPTNDPSIEPASVVVGRVATTIPFLGYGVILLSTFQGVALLLGLAVFALAAAWLLESFEDDIRVAHARRLAARRGGQGTTGATAGTSAA